MNEPYILVPRTPMIAESHGIKRGSGIVGTFQPNDEITIDYEGSIYGAPVNVKTWADRIVQAAGRHIEKYPTVARMTVPTDGWLAIGNVTKDEVAPPIPPNLRPFAHEVRLPGYHQRKLLVPHFNLGGVALDYDLNSIASEWLDHKLSADDLILTGDEWVETSV